VVKEVNMNVRSAIVASFGGAVALLAVVAASADTQYMDAAGCVGHGFSELSSGNAYSETVGCSGSSTYIAATAYPIGGGTDYCDINWTWQQSSWIFCPFPFGDEAAIYASHRIQFNGSYSNYAVTQD
jgi:hypothetical protein